jgi:cytochrome c peroxidase
MERRMSGLISSLLVRGFSIALLLSLLPAGVSLGAQAIPPPDLLPLNQIPVPEPTNLFQFVKNRSAAIKLGKALFWDMQAGSDGVQACASCHFSAGADNRLKNTVNPGTRGGDTTFQVRGPNDTLQPGDFPFHERQIPTLQGSQVLRDSNDVVGSQGVLFTQFTGIVPGSPFDSGTPITDAVFQSNGANMRRVTARNTPSNINAVFNFNNFWDGRAHFVFNGVNPFGPLDPSAGVWFNTNGNLVKQAVAIPFASLASQATGPPLDDTEMSYKGRTFPLLGRKMLSLTPLGQQVVHPNDSVLGPLSNAVLQANGRVGGSKGLKTTYTQMIKDAFNNNLWDSIQITPSGHTQMEANFSLYWGLAIQLYEATLVSDQTPFDRFLGGDRTALTQQQQDGFNLFFGAGGCSACHIGTEQTNASVRFAAFVTNSFHALMETMAVGTGQQIIYDNGYNNTAVRPTGDDIGRGGNAPFTNSLTGQPFPLAYSMLAELQAVGNLGFNPNLFQPGTPATPILPAQLPANFPVSNDGNFKVTGLRNVELTAPYFHNGGDMTLKEVVEFYARGGNFPDANAASVDAAFQDIGALGNAPDKIDALVAFMMSMTDERVRNESEPFDHPELYIPNGDGPLIKLSAKDASGTAALTLSVSIGPLATPTNKTTIVVSGTKDAGSTVQIQINSGQASAADTSTDTTWSKQINGLAAGTSTIYVTATDQVSNTATATAEVTVIVPDGNLKGDGVVDISDALRALRISTGQIVPTQLDMLRGDVAPMVNGVPQPDNSISIADALMILRKVVGLISF